jgi:hypothetical protein
MTLCVTFVEANNILIVYCHEIVYNTIVNIVVCDVNFL